MLSVVIALIIGYVLGGVVNVGILLAFCMRKMAKGRGK